jgi:AraC-like DNA-binding protein
VFPQTHVVIAQQSRRPVLCTPNHVVFYRAHQLYRRALRDTRGDCCLWLEVAPELVEQAGGLPTAPAGPGDAGTYLLALALACHLREHALPDRLLVEDAVLELFARALAPASPRAGARAARAGTRAAHEALVEGAKELLASGFAQPPSLRELAAALHVSPFHLARVFRAQTGYSPGSYVHGLRLRAAAERIVADPSTDLSRLALELGYCSPSHFTDRFRAAFGRPPSAVRGAQPRTIVEAARAAAA